METENVTSGMELSKFYNIVGDMPLEYSMELPRTSQIVLISLYSVTTLLSVGGNIIVMLVLSCSPRAKTDLTVFLINLALADMAMACFCIPFTFTETMLGRWVFGDVMCPLVLFMQVTSVGTSVFTNVAIGLDRFWAVQYPMKRRLTKNHARCVVVFCWFFAVSLGSVQLVIGHTQKNLFNNHYMCDEGWKYQSQGRIYSMFVLFITYILPLALLSFTYFKVGRTLWVEQAPGNVDEVRDRKRLKSKRKVIKMLIAIVMTFSICWLPLQVFHLVIDFAPGILDYISTPVDERTYFAMYYFCHWLAMANCLTNPLIYGFLHDSFRNDLKMLWRNCKFGPARATSLNWSVQNSRDERTGCHKGVLVNTTPSVRITFHNKNSTLV